MASFGGFGKFPLKFGGEPSHQEKAYKALRSMFGEGGSPPQDPLGETTFDGLWRRAKANARGALASFDLEGVPLRLYLRKGVNPFDKKDD